MVDGLDIRAGCRGLRSDTRLRGYRIMCSHTPPCRFERFCARCVSYELLLASLERSEAPGAAATGSFDVRRLFGAAGLPLRKSGRQIPRDMTELAVEVTKRGPADLSMCIGNRISLRLLHVGELDRGTFGTGRGMGDPLQNDQGIQVSAMCRNGALFERLHAISSNVHPRALPGGLVSAVRPRKQALNA